MSPRDPAPTRAAILASASVLLEEGGPDAVTLRSVGASAGVSRSAPYRHFGDKADLLRALARKTLLDMAGRIRHESARARPRDRMHRGCAAYVGYALAHPHHYQLVFGDAPIAEPSAELEAAADDAMQAITELVAEAQERGAIRPGPTREVATIVWVVLHGLAQLQITGHFHEPRTIDGATGLDDLLRLALRSLATV